MLQPANNGSFCICLIPQELHHSDWLVFLLILFLHNHNLNSVAFVYVHNTQFRPLSALNTAELLRTFAHCRETLCGCFVGHRLAVFLLCV